LTTKARRGENVAPSSERRIGFIPEFDGIRGFGVLFVVVGHIFLILLPSNGAELKEITGTFMFMDLFFVLSGFLITALLLREQEGTGRVGLGAFYIRRAVRLLPALYLLLVAHWIYASTQGPPNYPSDVERNTIFHAAVYGLNFQMNDILSPVARGLTHLWSLGVEEQFYIVLPLVVIFLLPARRHLRTVTIVLTTAIVVVAVRRYYMWDDATTGTWGWLRLYTHTDTRADSLMIGALLAYGWVHGVTVPRKVLSAMTWGVMVFVTWVLLFVNQSDPFAYKGGFTLISLAWAVMILACVESDWALRPVLRLRPARAVGRVSYGLYLWHVPVLWAVKEHMDQQPVDAQIAVAMALTTVVVLASWFLVERPLLHWKNKMDKRDRSATALVQAPTELDAATETAATELEPATETAATETATDQPIGDLTQS